MWRSYGYDVATCWDCRQCVGTLLPDGTREGANPALHKSRGHCRDPFPMGRNGQPLVHGGQVVDGRVLVPGNFVLNDPRFSRVRWDRCPVASVGHPDCPAPEMVEPWLVTAFNAANWTVDGASLRDFVEEPTDALKEAVLLIRREAEKMRKKRDG